MKETAIRMFAAVAIAAVLAMLLIAVSLFSPNKQYKPKVPNREIETPEQHYIREATDDGLIRWNGDTIKYMSK